MPTDKLVGFEVIAGVSSVAFQQPDGTIKRYVGFPVETVEEIALVEDPGDRPLMRGPGAS